MHEILKLADHQPGASVEIDVPDDAIGYELKAARCTDATPDVWPDPAQVMGVRVELFVDEWIDWGSFPKAYGGKYVRRGGEVAEFSGLKPLPETFFPVGKSRKLRVTLIADAPVRTRVTVEFY